MLEAPSWAITAWLPVKPDWPVEPWGPEATEFTREFVAGGEVRLSTDFSPVSHELSHAIIHVADEYVEAQFCTNPKEPAQKWVYLKALDPVKAGVPSEVKVFKGGFPPGYTFDNCEVHVYNSGEELATSLSRKRVPLTDDDVTDFQVVEYVGANKGRTLPAAPATFSRDLRPSLTRA